ncbi:hypothetical protein F5Y16DRAFT_423877 [Xylariaceae sp. FL0255]|nr:hypothetical protein F5Y16DRAFT_423877 [Xylariaceae sp. FL0255]
MADNAAPSSDISLDRILALHEAHTNLASLHNDAIGRINKLERRVNKLDDNSDSDTSSEASDLDAKYCIDVLFTGSDLEDQVRKELKRRGELPEADDGQLDSYDGTDEKIIQRVRIQSPSVLFLLSHVLGGNKVPWKGQNRLTFFRPFVWFAHAHSGMKAQLSELEERFSDPQLITKEVETQTLSELVSYLESLEIGSQEPSNASATDSSHRPSDLMDPEQVTEKKAGESFANNVNRKILEQAILESYQTLLALRCYVRFVDERIMPDIDCYAGPKAPDKSIIFPDLWSLFKPGDLIWLNKDLQFFNPSERVSHVRVARVHKIARPPAQTADPSAPYLATLGVYPLKFHPEFEEITSSLREKGQMFIDAVTTKHMVYGGWSLEPPAPLPPTTRPPGVGGAPPQPSNQRVHDTVRNEDLPQGFKSSRNETGFAYIESDVIVDVKEALRVSPSWRVLIESLGIFDVDETFVIQEKIEIIKWSGSHGKIRLSTIQDRVLAEDCFADIDTTEWIRQNAKWKSLQLSKEANLTADELMLLPKRIFAYALRERKFFSGNIQSFHRINLEGDPFASLKIDEEHIRTVKSVVWSHFQKKEMESRQDFLPQMNQDLIRGKGRGLVILLHGAPGVGKTATAEAVAMWHQKPLFVITCGDLEHNGFTPQGVESSLGEIFRFAQLWDCILLLDEADVFLSQRETSALQRNALVSVFLRVLEYYTGILFLTTNRVGTLDEAFKSRVHLSLFYPALGRNQTEQIMEMNLNRLESIEAQRAQGTSEKSLVIFKDQICKFVVDHWDRHAANDGEGRWNGRQLRNSVQIAASLALYDREDNPDAKKNGVPAILDEKHFRKVEKTMTLFEGYMSKTRGGSASFIAKQRSERDDAFRGGDARRETGSYEGLSTGGYVPYQSTPRTPQSSYQQPQHLSPSGGGMYGYPQGMPSNPTSYGQGDPYRPAQTGGSPYDPSPSFTVRPSSQPGAPFDPRN